MINNTSISFVLLFAEPLSGWKAIFAIVGIMLGLLVAIGVGAYVFVLVLAKIINSRTGGWESSAKPLGLQVASQSGGIYKSLVGERDGYAIKLSHHGYLESGEHSVDGALCEVTLKSALTFPLEMTHREYYYQKLAVQLDMASGVTGDPVLDEIFKTETPDLKVLNAFLNTPIPGENPTLLNDILLATKRCRSVKLTSETVVLGVVVELGDHQELSSLIDQTIRFAKRVEAAGAATAVLSS